jgi:hypothetical protein
MNCDGRFGHSAAGGPGDSMASLRSTREEMGRRWSIKEIGDICTPPPLISSRAVGISALLVRESQSTNGILPYWG